MISAEQLTAIVVDWNLPEHTVRCVDALVSDGVPPGRIVVVENGPTEDNWSKINAELAGCVRVRVDPNVGFARANNIGARALPGRAYLLVNNDAFVSAEGTVLALLTELERPDVGIVVPRLLNPDQTLQPSVAPFTTPLPAFVRASGLSRFFPDRWQPHLSTHWSHGWSREIEMAIGAVSLIQAETWDQLDGLRETSFMYAEDLDFCWRARKHGWRTRFCAEAEFVHLGGASSARRWSSRERAAQVGEADAQIIREHLSPARAALALTFMRLGLACRVGLFRLLRRGAAAESCLGSLEGLGRGREQRPREQVLPAEVEVVPPV